MTLSPRLSSRIWAIQKEIKDAYPKKVCHMSTRHVKKKEKEERRKKNIYIAHVQEKNTKREREIDHPMEFIRYPPKIFHTLAPLDQVV